MSNAPYAQGRRAWGMCARSNIKMLLKDMIEDPRTGLLVHPDWAEMPDPRPLTDIIDGTALERPAPQLDRIGTMVVLGNIADVKGDVMPPLVCFYDCGIPSVVAS